MSEKTVASSGGSERETEMRVLREKKNNLKLGRHVLFIQTCIKHNLVEGPVDKILTGRTIKPL